MATYSQIEQAIADLKMVMERDQIPEAMPLLERLGAELVAMEHRQELSGRMRLAVQNNPPKAVEILGTI